MPQPQRPIPVGVTNRHLHISQSDLDILFGSGHSLGLLRHISQKGQYAAHETVAARGTNGVIEKIRIVGPARQHTQLEISRSDAMRLGVDPPVRYSGDLSGTAGITLQGPAGTLELKEGVIVPQRHIHMNSHDARDFGVQDRDRVFVAPISTGPIAQDCEPRSIIFGNVLIRTDRSFVLDFHIDTDEANASGLKTGDQVYIVKRDPGSKANLPKKRCLITESEVRQAIFQHRKIAVPADALITPAARDLAREHDVFVTE